MTAIEIGTCSDSLLAAGGCCEEACTATAAWAVLETDTLVEHARCFDHAWSFPGAVAVKPLQWRNGWAP